MRPRGMELRSGLVWIAMLAACSDAASSVAHDAAVNREVAFEAVAVDVATGTTGTR